jgi:hypothetical protein
MPDMSVRVEAGAVFAALDRRLLMTDRFARAAVSAGAQPLVTDWKQRVLETAFKTGTYMRSIHGPSIEEVVKEDNTYKGEVGTDITDPPYPLYIEYGTPRIAARSPMTKAVEATRETVIKTISETVTTLIKAAGLGL